MNRKALILFLLVILSGCSMTPDFESYEGKPLSIAVLGEPPEVREDRVSFTEISFSDLQSMISKDYDAIFITEEHLQQASEGKYADTYLASISPIFFISSSSHIPFTIEDDKFSEKWEWSPGQSYAVGILSSLEDPSLKRWGYGLYNDEKTDEHVEEVYSRIFTTIDELNF
ncbi:MAG: hypothetical protein ACQEUT_11605 [Bacillota bacterium]